MSEMQRCHTVFVVRGGELFVRQVPPLIFKPIDGFIGVWSTRLEHFDLADFGCVLHEPREEPDNG